MYDVIIIGAGAAGITAAIYAARANLKFEILSKDIGGLTMWSSNIENYPGYHHLSGIELMEKFQEHMADYNIDVKLEIVKSVEKSKSGFKVTSDEKVYETKTVIVATGHTPRKLKVPGADKYEGKGLAFCATCDGPLFAGKEVAVIGGGDSALDAANTLSKVVKKIYIINVNKELTGNDKSLKENVMKTGKVTVLNSSATKEIFGDKNVKGLKYEKDGKEHTLAVEGVFVEIGSVPSVDFMKDLVKLSEHNAIIVDKEMQASVPGIFAAGDINDVPGKQTVISAGDGAKALLSASRYISKLK